MIVLKEGKLKVLMLKAEEVLSKLKYKNLRTMLLSKNQNKKLEEKNLHGGCNLKRGRL